MIDRKKLIELIPWYINGTLVGSELEAVIDFVTNDEEGRAALAAWSRIQALMYSDDEKLPPDRVENKLFDRIRSKSFEQLGIFHPYALCLSLVILVLMWTFIRPGITIHWSASNSRVTAFRIYRSEANGSRYQLLDELPANPPTTDYSFVDLFIWPFKEYVYYVEGMNQTDSLGPSPVAASKAMVALPGQLALLCGSFISGYGIMLLIRYRKLLLIGNLRVAAI